MALGLPFLVALVSSCVDAGVTRPDASMARSTGRVANAVGPKVVVSQIYGGGGNAGATLTNDFIELFNAGDAPAVVTGWSVQYASATGASWNSTTLTGTIEPGRYYLVQQAAGAGGSQALPTPDATGTAAMSATVGKVAVRTSAAAFTTACPSGTDVVAVVGFGTTANCGGTTANLSNTTALLRNDQGCAETFAIAAPAPRNSATPAAPCGVVVPPATVSSVTVTPTSATLLPLGTQAFTAAGFDASNNPVATTFTWSSSNPAVATVSATGLATAVAPGDATITATSPNSVSGSATIRVDAPPPPPDIRISELHYDNNGADVGEAIEVEGPAGTDLTDWTVVLYNGNGGVAYNTTVLSGAIADRCSGRGVVVLDYPQDGIQNGSPDGLALVDADDQVVEFLSYEGTFTATDGPAAGMTSRSIGVEEASTSPVGSSLQRRPDGVWAPPAPHSFGRCNVEGPAPAVPGISFTGRVASDPPLPVGFEAQLFATERDGVTGAVIPTTFNWTSETPTIASVDARGVIRSLAPGTAVFRATAADGASGTYSLQMAVGTPGTAAAYGNHSEFGEPTDSDPSDDFLIRRVEFTSSFNKLRNIPNWVTYNLEATHIGAQDRCNCFTYDPLLPEDFRRYTTADYTGAGAYHGYGIDRGHLTRSFDRTTGTLDNARTFYFSNVFPQAADNNQGPWAIFENHLGNLATSQNKEVYVITGASGTKGTVKDEGLITIPSHTWKVAVIMPRDQGLPHVDSWDDLEVVAVIMPNDAGIRNVPWETYKTTVDAVEALSGYDLLALLPDQVEIAVESGTRPPVAAVAGPYSINEGGTVQFHGSATDPDAGQSLALSWSFGDGQAGTGTAPTHTYAQNGTYTVVLTATDPLGLVGTASTTVTVNNVAPTIESFSLPSTAVSGVPVSASGTFTDPGPDAPWSFAFDWATGSPSTGVVTSPAIVASGTHTFLAAGTYTVRFTVTDKDGGSGFAERQISVGRMPVTSDVNPNRVNLNGEGNGRVIVRVLSASSFDATRVIVASARVGDVAPVGSSTDDVNGDGRADLVLHFERGALVAAGVLSPATAHLVLQADLSDGRQIESRAAVLVR